MSVTQFIPAQPNEFAYFDIQISEACDVVLERHPLIGFLTKSYETVQGEVVIEAWPVSTVGENVTPNFIQRHDGTFTDTQGECTCYSIIDMMYERGFEPDNSIALPPENPKELSEFVWRPLRNPQS